MRLKNATVSTDTPRLQSPEIATGVWEVRGNYPHPEIAIAAALSRHASASTPAACRSGRDFYLAAKARIWP